MTAAPRPDQQLYVIVWGAYVKVGCSIDPIDRLARVSDPNRREDRPPRQRGNPELVGTVPGGFGPEAWLHAALAGHRAVGEWYHLRGAVTDLVDAAARTGLADLPSRPTRQRRRDAQALRLLPGHTIAAGVSNRGGEVGLRRRHAVVVEEELITAESTVLVGRDGPRAVCGSGVRQLLDHFDPADDRACPDCARSLPR